MDENNKETKEDFEARLKAAREEFEQMETQTGRKASGPTEGAMRSGKAGSELLANVFAGAFLGWLIDKFFLTAPWGMITMMVLGFISGVMRANAAMQQHNKSREKQ